MDTRLKKETNKILAIAAASVFTVVFIFGSTKGFQVAFLIAACFAGMIFVILKAYLNDRSKEYEKVLQAIAALADDGFEEISKGNFGVF